MEKKLDGNYTRMQFWTSPGGNTLQSNSCTGTYFPSIKLSKLDEPDCWRSGDELISDVLLGPPHRAKQGQGDRLEPTYSSSVRIRDAALRTCQKRWTIGRSGERGSGISVLAAWPDDDDDIEKLCHCSHRRRWNTSQSSCLNITKCHGENPTKYDVCYI